MVPCMLTADPGVDVIKIEGPDGDDNSHGIGASNGAGQPSRSSVLPAAPW
jgi:crotonobetainyl-CoA:carnitine CoA-transferase CaiB-like acyl-CoA transferase